VNEKFQHKSAALFPFFFFPFIENIYDVSAKRKIDFEKYFITHSKEDILTHSKEDIISTAILKIWILAWTRK